MIMTSFDGSFEISELNISNLNLRSDKSERIWRINGLCIVSFQFTRERDRSIDESNSRLLSGDKISFIAFLYPSDKCFISLEYCLLSDVIVFNVFNKEKIKFWCA